MNDLFTDDIEEQARRGRGALRNLTGRFEALSHHRADDGWEPQEQTAVKTQVLDDHPRRILTRNQSPDVPFDRSINPYKGCEHGCIYCFARPTHTYLGLSAGLDFESRIFAKPDAAQLLEKELRKPGYIPATIAIGTNTDPYQPIEKDRQIMRRILEVLDAYNHPVAIVTKGALVTRDTDILGRMARRGLAKVALSLTTLDPHLSRRMEPRASAPQVRLRAIGALARAGVPTGFMVAPIIPALNDHEIEKIIEAGARAGATWCSYVALRLPREVSPLFRDWLDEHYPARAHRIMAQVREMHGGKDYDSNWGKRMKGEGVYANLIARRVEAAMKRHDLRRRLAPLDCSRFALPARKGDQFTLF
ncbi:PA0069 family radical SAM protein [Pontivivens nitratireducens]|uniref:PA0069 family radical SAM protein n=1 Tax=Pontivivens nitratireducens TaxID=2758038 RepID=UPI00163B334C|nr:PA0069 family radical SAM protein [Pontibrevibacter nitratireducens]